MIFKPHYYTIVLLVLISTIIMYSNLKSHVKVMQVYLMQIRHYYKNFITQLKYTTK